MHEHRDEQALSTVVDPHHEDPVGWQPGEKAREQEGQRECPGETVAFPEQKEGPRSLQEAHDEAGSKDTVTLPQPGDGEPRPAELFEEAYHKPGHDTGQQKGNLDFRGEDTGQELGERSESARSTAAVESGAVRSATAYQRAPTRHLSNRDRSSRRPTFPEA